MVLSALHSTGWPDAIGRLNRARLLTRWTDGFIGVADSHGKHLVEQERFPAHKVYVIPNGVEVARFHPLRDGTAVRDELRIARTTPVAGIVAALRPEKNHELFLRAAARVRDRIPPARFLIVGDGAERDRLERLAAELKLTDAVCFLGNRDDIPDVLAALDVFVLTSKIEANPVSILEAMASGKPVIAPRVGSISESLDDGRTGFLTEPDNLRQVADRMIELLCNRELARRMGQAGRAAAVERWSLERMVKGYEGLIVEIYRRKCHPSGPSSRLPPGLSENPRMKSETLP